VMTALGGERLDSFERGRHVQAVDPDPQHPGLPEFAQPPVPASRGVAAATRSLEHAAVARPIASRTVDSLRSFTE
jgi:hypothetical protein